MNGTTDDPKFTVLFVCNHNSARSQMAEALLNRSHGDKFIGFSAGLTPGPAVHPMAVAVMKELDIDISQSRPKGFNEFIGRRFDYVISVCDAEAEKCPVVVGSAVPVNMGVPDPASLAASSDDPDSQLNYFRAARDHLRQILRFAVLGIEKQIRENMTKDEKKNVLEKLYAQGMRRALDCMQEELLKLPHPEPIVCILGSQLKLLLLRRLPSLRNQQLWPLVSLVIALFGLATRGDFKDLLIPGSGQYWTLGFVVLLGLSVFALAYTMINARKQKDPDAWVDGIIEDIRFREIKELQEPARRLVREGSRAAA